MEGDVEDEDSLPGCYYLDIDIEGLQPQGLWIRPDYVRIYDALHCDYPSPMVRTGNTPCAVITGQPGVGKSIWIWYAARRRMAAKEPFLLYYGSQLRLFVEDGVYDVPDRWQNEDFRYFIWTFVDSDESKEGIPSHFVRPSTPLFIIFTRSPEANCWNRLHKTMQEPEIIIMNPWSKSEILQIWAPPLACASFQGMLWSGMSTD
ncbi:hypothetical protein BS47DRAFT_1070022 [Hydnum rufescens UP504]|uniref:Uncharacterized protein n=1 Tax=Hydnum rufescens UP504 TaxID=1448309 RepID=A0A9P6AB61_9AGAM|nr:hypothetical protein BS47DRAFT_1070022 [Hydnum rufescens UP504]